MTGYACRWPRAIEAQFASVRIRQFPEVRLPVVDGEGHQTRGTLRLPQVRERARHVP